MKVAVKAVLVVLLGLVVVIISVGIGYGIGFDAGKGSIECTKGTVLSVEVTKADEFGNGVHVLSIGDCSRIDEAAFIAAVDALASGQPVPTTTTTAPSTSTTAATGATATTGP